MQALAYRSGDVEAVVAIKSKDLSSPFAYLEIARPYNEAGKWERCREKALGFLREDGELIERFDVGWNVADLAKHHQRTRGAIQTRLVRLGKINNRSEA